MIFIPKLFRESSPALIMLKCELSGTLGAVIGSGIEAGSLDSRPARGPSLNLERPAMQV
jgi:hypothetical protein